MYEKFLRKSKLKILLKLDDLMDYLRSAFQMMTYVVDTSYIETLVTFSIITMGYILSSLHFIQYQFFCVRQDVSETISVILKLSRERKCKLNSTDSTIKNKKQFSRNQKVTARLDFSQETILKLKEVGIFHISLKNIHFIVWLFSFFELIFGFEFF